MPQPILKYAHASRYAEKLREWLAPHCQRIEIAGDVRRKRPVCDGIVVVCISEPRWGEAPDEPAIAALCQRRRRSQTDATMPAREDARPTTLNAVAAFLDDYVKRSGGKAWFNSSVGVPAWKSDSVPDSKYLSVHLPKCELKVHLTSEQLFVMRWIELTGPNQHFDRLREQAKRLHGWIDPTHGLAVRGQKLAPKTEEEFYAALELNFVPVEER